LEDVIVRGDKDEEGDASCAGNASDIEWEWEGREDDDEGDDAGYGNSPIPAAWGPIVEVLMLGKVVLGDRDDGVGRDEDDE
jgi:hypothetical protein